MKLKTVQHQPTAAYPTIEDYQAHRDAYLRRLAIGTGALLVAGLATSYGGDTGTAAAPQAATEQAAIKLGGKPAAPAPPEAAAPTKTPGEATCPAPVKQTQPLQPLEVATMGIVAAPAPVKPQPVPAAAAPVAIKGDVASPKAPIDEPANPAGGLRAPKPAPAPEK